MGAAWTEHMLVVCRDLLSIYVCSQQEPDLSVVTRTLACAHLHMVFRHIVLTVIGKVLTPKADILKCTLGVSSHVCGDKTRYSKAKHENQQSVFVPKPTRTIKYQHLFW